MHRTSSIHLYSCRGNKKIRAPHRADGSMLWHSVSDASCRASSAEPAGQYQKRQHEEAYVRLAPGSDDHRMAQDAIDTSGRAGPRCPPTRHASTTKMTTDPSRILSRASPQRCNMACVSRQLASLQHTVHVGCAQRLCDSY